MKTEKKTPAKLNLGLEILRRRADGYHEINSVFLPIPLFDELTFEDIDQSIEFHCASLPDSPNNLCVRAANALKDRFQIGDRGVRITLRKNIPVGAGLGGGSSDAACVLNTLNTMWELHASASDLHEIARGIGADAPFFLAPQPAVVRGIGDNITPIAFHVPLHILLACPSIHINTAWAYQQVRCDPPRLETNYRDVIVSLRDVNQFSQLFRNDFEEFVFPHYPELREIKVRLLQSGAVYAAMSGSGSAMWGAYGSMEEAEGARGLFSGYQHHVFEVQAGIVDC